MPLIRKTERQLAAGNPLLVGAALFTVMLIWGASFLAIKYAVISFPPFLLGHVRFAIAGGILFAGGLLAGNPLPERRQWGGAAVVGTVMLAFNSAPLAIAEKNISSGLAAVGVASIPLWTALFAGLLQKWPVRREWLALFIGLAGVVLLNFDGELKADPTGAVAIMIAAAAWALGTVLTQKVPLPSGIMAMAAAMLCASAVLGVCSLALGESFPTEIDPLALGGMAYLTVISSLAGICLHGYLLRFVRPTVANSFAFTNPVVAVGLGLVIGGESISAIGIMAMLVILAGLVILTRTHP